MWNVVFVTPGAEDVPLLARLAQRDDVRLCGVVDPVGDAPGTALAEAMGLPVWRELATAALPAGTVLAASDGAAHRLGAVAQGFRALTPQALLDACSGAPPAAVADTTSLEQDIERLEDALDRMGVLQRLLELAMRRADAAGGSLLLRDPGSDDLYVGASVGLEPAVARRVRIRPGQGIAGRVGADRRPVRTDGDAGTGNARGVLSSSLSLPLVDGDELLGVLNVNAAPGEPPLADAGEAALHSLAPRLAAVVRAADALRRDRVWNVRRSLGRELRDLVAGDLPLETALAGWAASLALALDATHAAVALLRDDGSLLLAEGAATGDTRTGEVNQHETPWHDVLERGRPVLVHARQGAAGDGERTLHYLPVGSPLHAVLAIGFEDAAADHAFQDLADGLLQFLDQRLPWLVAERRQEDHRRRLGELAEHLAGRPAAEEGALPASLMRLTGAGHVEVLDDDGAGSAVGPAGWLILDEDPEDRQDARITRLRVAPDGAPVYELTAKRRLHSLDSDLFTAFDAELARSLVLASRPAPVVEPPASAPVAAAPADAVEPLLDREIHRADRYHVAFSLSVYRPKYRAALPRDLAAAVQDRLRLSDLALCAPDGLLMVFAPEEPHAVSQLERRVTTVLRELAGNQQLEVACGHAVYPGDCATPSELLAAAVASLEARCGGA